MCVHSGPPRSRWVHLDSRGFTPARIGVNGFIGSRGFTMAGLGVVGFIGSRGFTLARPADVGFILDRGDRSGATSCHRDHWGSRGFIRVCLGIVGLTHANRNESDDHYVHPSREP